MQLGLPIGLGAKAANKPGGSLGLGFGIDLSKLGNKEDYQDEFMAKYDEFSESWRQLLKKDKRFWTNGESKRTINKYIIF